MDWMGFRQIAGTLMVWTGQVRDSSGPITRSSVFLMQSWQTATHSSRVTAGDEQLRLSPKFSYRSRSRPAWTRKLVPPQRARRSTLPWARTEENLRHLPCPISLLAGSQLFNSRGRSGMILMDRLWNLSTRPHSYPSDPDVIRVVKISRLRQTSFCSWNLHQCPCICPCMCPFALDHSLSWQAVKIRSSKQTLRHERNTMNKMVVPVLVAK